MQIQINGQPKQLQQPLTVSELLNTLELTSQRVAVEVNENLVKRACFDQTSLADGDRVEIVTLVGGG